MNLSSGRDRIGIGKDGSSASPAPFTLVLAGGGARGYAHVGVLRALEDMSLAPAGIVGVSMGAVVAATYALREDWYERLMEVDLAAFPHPPRLGVADSKRSSGVRGKLDYAQVAWSMVTGWGAPNDTAEAGRAMLENVLGRRNLEEGRVPVVVCATDLRSGSRVEFRSGSAVTAVCASSALAGVLPPVEHGEAALVDGAYSDIAPVDVARSMGAPIVIGVDPTQDPGAGPIENGLQAVLRAMEICHHTHAHLRLAEADLVLRPAFHRFIEVLDFSARGECVDAGVGAVQSRAADISALLASARVKEGAPRSLEPARARVGPHGISIHLGDVAPDFVADTTQGTLHFHEWKSGHWAVLVSHPGDFTPVCTTELAALAALAPQFDRRRTKIMAISVDPLGLHYSWVSDIERLAGAPVTFPIAADPNRWVTRLYGMIHPNCGQDAARSTFIVDAKDRVRLMLAYPPSTGRDFAEILRVIDSLQLADRHGIATPAGWHHGQDVMIPVDMPTAEAEGRFGKGIETKAPYLRTTPQPTE